MEKTKKELVTERLILRRVKKEDVEPMFLNWASDPEVTKYLTWNAHESIETTKTIVNHWLEEENDPKTIRFIITLKGSDEPFGCIDVVGYSEGNPEVGYCLSRKLWNNGYMTEAFRAFSEYLFDLGFEKIIIAAELNNIGSNRVIEKCGFRFTHQEYREHSSPFKPEPVTINWYEKRKG